jgi:hypothetical protein
MLPTLTIPAAYVDLGFAGNGDLLVVGTDELIANPTPVWIARYTPAGSLKARVKVERRMTSLLGADRIDVDPTNDSVLFDEVDHSTGLHHVYRVASATGKSLAKLDLHRSMNAIAVDPKGHLFGISATYGTFNNRRPCILDRVAAGGGLASGVDYVLKTCETRGYSTTPAYFMDPMAIDVDNDGNLIFLDWGEAGFRRNNEPAGLGLTVVTPGLAFVRHWHLPKAWQGNDFFRGFSALSWYLAGDADGRIYIDQELRNADQSRRTGFRLGVFDRSGSVLATFGVGGDQAGVTWPMSPRVDAAGRLWVIDFDGARSYTVKRLDGLPAR